ncbi:N-6 DNA methylase [Salegentibacter tibetensis]
MFTGDAGGGESNIRRYIIENDLLEAIIQMPNNLFYNTGITTYIWLLSNNKAENRKGKVQLIDGGQLFRKLRKNLGNKNCEFAPEYIDEIVKTYAEMQAVSRKIDNETNAEVPGIAAQVFDNEDFGYYKVTIERPKRLKAHFTAERIMDLRYDKQLKEPMQWVWETFGEEVYTKLKDHEKEILAWTEENDLNLSSANRKKLLSPKTWKKQKEILELAEKLHKNIGEKEYLNFNNFKIEVEGKLKDWKLKPGASEKNAIYNAVSWYDAEAEKVIKKKEKLSGEKLSNLLAHLSCTEEQLPDFGYFPTGKAGEFVIFETESNLRDYENVPLKEPIYSYFLEEVKPHVPEAWINLDAVKIGYEISFNKYFYRHTPLRSLDIVAKEILELEEKNEGLILEILNLNEK